MKRRFLKISLRWWAIIVVVVFVGGVLLVKSSAPKSPYEEQVTVTRGMIIQEVVVTGRTEPFEDVELAFERGGKIAKTYVVVGEKVTQGQTLVELDRTELSAQLLDARANLDSQIAKLDELRRGTRPEDIQVKQTELQKAEQDLANYYSDVPDVLSDAYAYTNDAVRKQLDELFSDDDSLNPQISFAVSNSQIETDMESLRIKLTGDLTLWKNELATITRTSPQSILNNALDSAQARLLKVRDLLNLANSALIAHIGLSQTTVTSYKANVSTALTNVNTSIASVNGKRQSILSQDLVVKRIKDELAVKLAGNTPEAIRAQEAAVRQAEAKVKVVEAQLGQAVLRAPIAGVVTQQDAKVGEIVAANVKLVALISQGELKIEANVPEADIAKITIGNSGKVTLDAYGSNVIFGAHVRSIDPGETVIDGVPTYKTTILFDTHDTRVRTGMTANVTITAAKKDEVLVIPQRMVTNRGADAFVLILGDDGTAREVKIITGLRGSDGNIEIIEGLTKGDKVVIEE